MPIARSEYARDLIDDANIVSTDPVVVHAIVLNDALNGLRKAVLDLSESNRKIAQEIGALADTARQA